jgi:hypothetical protein
MVPHRDQRGALEIDREYFEQHVHHRWSVLLKTVWVMSPDSKKKSPGPKSAFRTCRETDADF